MRDMFNHSTTVYAGLSGGVDSAVSAALLAQQGFRVVVVFIKIWQPEFIECTWERDRLDAMRVAAHLNIPFQEIDLSAEYKKQVIDEMVLGYSRGETPNPDTLCNERIKFGLFFDWARKAGADFVATGHYARIYNGDTKAGPLYKLLRGVDTEKDQSYFLYTLSQEVLAHTLFPVGGMKKSDVRRMAEKFNLPVAKKADSQGLCFVGDVSMQEFLSRYVPVRRGVVVDADGHAVGEHGGAALYTVGQRHGFSHPGTENVPHYVCHVDTQNNIVRIAPRREDSSVSEFDARDIHWVGGADESGRVREVQVRYREKPSPCTVFPVDKKSVHHITINEPRVATRGQAAVFYDGDECLGGGIIHT